VGLLLVCSSIVAYLYWSFCHVTLNPRGLGLLAVLSIIVLMVSQCQQLLVFTLDLLK
jgi:hypothetical protein